MKFIRANRYLHAFVDINMIASGVGTLFYAWKGDPRAIQIMKFAIETASSWLSFSSILFAALLVFIGFIYTIQDDLFWELLTESVNIERKAYKAMLYLGLSCLILIMSSQPQLPVFGWRSTVLMLGVMLGIKGIIETFVVFSCFYSLDYAAKRQRRQTFSRRNSSTSQNI